MIKIVVLFFLLFIDEAVVRSLSDISSVNQKEDGYSQSLLRERPSFYRQEFPYSYTNFRSSKYSVKDYPNLNRHQTQEGSLVYYKPKFFTNSNAAFKASNQLRDYDHELINVPDKLMNDEWKMVDRIGLNGKLTSTIVPLNEEDSGDDEQRKITTQSLIQSLPDISHLQKAQLVSANEARHLPVTKLYKRIYEHDESDKSTSFGDIYFVAIVAGCSVAAITGVISAGYCFYKIQEHKKSAADVEYPAYGVVGPATKETVPGTGGDVSPSGDRKLAQSAQMYHYHHQKQQMIATEKAATSRHTSASDVDSDEDNEEGEYTVYECPGLAPTGEMEVKNPLFQDDITPVSTPPVTGTSSSTNGKH